MNPLISAAELAQQLQGGPAPILLDVRWSLGRDDGNELYAAGHIPGAVFVDMERELSSAPGAHTGRHPLPLPEDFQAAARSWGITDDSQVVVYDDAGALAAARAWWLLKHAGFDRVTVLDGGLDAWRQLPGTELVSGAEHNPPGSVALSWGKMPVVDFDELDAVSGTLIDSRATARYLGIEEPIDPVAGHIPGARNRPTTDNLDSQAHFLPAQVLHAEFAKLGVQNDSVAYCGSGITAAHQVLAAAAAGITMGLYPGSWSQYVSHPEAPVATSDEQHRH
ncbi:rhodanese-like domain-containing protein [Glutamicibacter sp.]|uniref:sulfurtransferase n=1 Tax=Glutamicibacter sp. TaxID=1931995 RepID=UPI0028BDB865|nr:rhodanese-like domain-containing protein [Glutamicibacter sp.]